MGIKIVFIINIIILFLLSTYILLKYKKKLHNPQIRYLLLFVVCYLIGLILFVLRNNIPDFLSIVIGTTLFATGSVNLYIATRAVLGLDYHWKSRYYIPIFLVALGHTIFTYIYFSTAIKMSIYYSFAILYSTLSMWLFWRYASQRFHFFDKFSSVVFLIGVIIFFIILLRVLSINAESYFFSNTDFFIFLPNSYMLLLNVWFIALLKYRIKD